MKRREFLAGCLTLGAATIAGCLSGESSPNETPITLNAVDILNRRDDPYQYEFIAERDGETIRQDSGRIDGTDNSSVPTGISYSDWPDEHLPYTFTLSIGDGEQQIRGLTPTHLNIHDRGTGCTRVVFVINLGDRLTSHARTPCTDR
jgi:hypothetical protein